MTWKKCGHPRTPENNASVTAHQPRGRCRICKRATWRQYAAGAKGRAACARATAKYRSSPKGWNPNAARDRRRDAKDAAMIEMIDQQLTKILQEVA